MVWPKLGASPSRMERGMTVLDVYKRQGLFPGGSPGNGQAHAAMKKIFRYLILLASLSLHAAAWGLSLIHIYRVTKENLED